MIVLAIKHHVRDYDAWKKVFGNFPPTAGGAKFYRINRAVDDPDVVLVVAGFDSAQAAQAFGAMPELQAKMQEAGVVDAPRIEMYEEVESGTA
jgi:hypothetical protein